MRSLIYKSHFYWLTPSSWWLFSSGSSHVPMMWVRKWGYPFSSSIVLFVYHHFPHAFHHSEVVLGWDKCFSQLITCKIELALLKFVHGTWEQRQKKTPQSSPKSFGASCGHGSKHGVRITNAGWWCNNHLEKWWSSSMGRMTSHIWHGK